MEAQDYYAMSRLEEQLEELEVLQAMFFSPGEFEIEDKSSYDKAGRLSRRSSLESPKILSLKFRLLVSAKQDSDEREMKMKTS